MTKPKTTTSLLLGWILLQGGGGGLLASPLISAVLLLSAPQAQAEAAAAERLTHKGYAVDIAALKSEPARAEILASLNRQIDIAEDAGLDEATRAFFKSVPVAAKRAHINKAENPGSYSGEKKSITMFIQVYPADRPIFLHELLHAYHHQKLPQGFQNADILEFYRRALDRRMYPPDSYMMKNHREYFAMTASVYLHGSAAREPHTRKNLVSKQPVYAQWLAKEFGPR